jgi:hypothetical protein
MNRQSPHARRSVDAIRAQNRSFVGAFVARHQSCPPPASSEAVIDLTNDSDTEDLDLCSAPKDDAVSPRSLATEKRCNIQECKSEGEAPRRASIQECKSDLSTKKDRALWKKHRPSMDESVVSYRLTSEVPSKTPERQRPSTLSCESPIGNRDTVDALLGSEDVDNSETSPWEEGKVPALMNPVEEGAVSTAMAATVAPTKNTALPGHRQELELPTTKDLVAQCWTCGVLLHRNDEKDDDACPYYAMHAHIVLGGVGPNRTIPMCSVCAEKIAALEQEELPDQEQSSYCSGCGVSEEDYGDVFFLCDNTDDECARAFCFHCVAKCSGGGRSGIVAAHQLTQEEDAPWHCPACRPTPELLSLQEQVTLFWEQQEQNIVRDLDYLLGQLLGAEEEKKRCEYELLAQNLELKKLELRQSIQEDALPLTIEDEELNELVQVAFDQWNKDWLNHDERLSDYISGVLDELETEHEFTAAMCYQAIGMVDIAHQNESTETPAPDEAWIRAADLEVERRMQERNGQLERNILPDEAYEADVFMDVEDLGTATISGEGNETCEDAKILALRPGFPSKLQRPSSQRLQAAMSNEDSLQISVQMYVGDDQDQQILLQEKKNAVMGSKNRFHIRNEFRSFTKSRKRNSNCQRRRSSTSVLREPSEPQLTLFCQSECEPPSVCPVVSIESGADTSNNTPDTTHNKVSRQFRQECAGPDVSQEQSVSEDLQEDIAVLNDSGTPIEMCDVAETEFSPNTYKASQLLSKRIVEQVMKETIVAGVDGESQGEVMSITGSPQIRRTNKRMSTPVIESAAGNDTSRHAIDEHDLGLKSKMQRKIVSKKATKGLKSNSGTPDSKRTTRKALKRKIGFEVDTSTPDEILREIVVSANTPGKRRKNVTSPSPSGQSAISISSSITDNDIPFAVSDKELFDTGSSNEGTEIQKIVLCSLSDAPNSDGTQPIRTIRVNRELSKHLKPHQVEGVKFMWRNCFSDFAYYRKGRPDQSGGCILAHSMGLVSSIFLQVLSRLYFSTMYSIWYCFLLQGKSLSTIALLHTVLTSTPEPLVKKVLLVVPVNTLANWENGMISMRFLVSQISPT